MKGIKVSVMAFVSAILSGCLVPDAIKKSESVAQQLYTDGVIQSKNLSHEDTTLHYVAGGNSNKPAIVFIHGTPGSWRVFGPQLEDSALQNSAYLVAVDRPGWGGVTCNKPTDENIARNPGQTVKTTVAQAKKPS